MSGGISPVDDFQNLTLDEYIAGIHDQYFKDFGLLGYFMDRAQQESMVGGDHIAEVINVGQNDQGGSYAGFDVFNNRPVETLKTAYFNYAKYQWPITAGADEILRNRGLGREQIADLWMNKADISMTSLRKRLNTDLWTDGTGNAGKNLDGIAIAVDSAGIYGLVDRSSVSQWSAIENAVGGALNVLGTNGMVQTMDDTSLGDQSGSMVDTIWTTAALRRAYEDLLDGNIRYESMAMGDASFAKLAFRGLPIRWDAVATTQILWWLAAETFKVTIHPERNFHKTPIFGADQGLQQDAFMANILLWIQLLCLEPRRNGKQTGVTG